MPEQIPCPSCARLLRVPDELLGREVRCPSCTTTFTAAAPAPDPLPASITADGPAAPERSRRPAKEDRPRRRDEDDEDSPAPSRFRDDDVSDGRPNHAVLVLVLGIIGVVLAVLGICVLPYILDPIAFGLSLTAWIIGHNDLNAIRARTMDPRGHEMVKAGRICGIVGTILPVVSATCWCAFFVVYFVFIIGLAGAGAGGGR